MGIKLTQYQLSDIVFFRNGAGIKQEFFTTDKSGIPLVKVSNFTLDSIDTSSEFTLVDLKHAENWQQHLLKENDILIATVGSWPPNWSSVVGKIVRVPQDASNTLQNQNTCCLTPRELVDNSYLFYALKSGDFLNWVVNIAQGSANQARIPIKKLGDYLISLPDLNEQRKRAKVLLDLDKKITLNRQINQTLEQMAQTLFKSWFVDFDPVIDNALDAGNEILEPLQARAELRQKVRASQDFQPLPADVRALFPAEFEESELGCVPKGWELLPVSKAILINPSVKLTKGTLAKFADMKALPTTGYSVEGIETKPYSGGAKFQKNDVLLARITPCLENGKTGFVDFLSEEEVGFGSTEFVVLRATKKIHFGFVACLARDDAFRAHAIQSMVGSSGRQRVQNSCFDAYQIAVPEQSVMSKFSDLVEVSFSKMTTTNAEIASLSQLRDTLLPKLISGELRLDEIPSP